MSTATKKKSAPSDEVSIEMGAALTGLFSVIRNGYVSTFASAEARRKQVHEDVKATKRSIARGAGAEGEPFRI